MDRIVIAPVVVPWPCYITTDVTVSEIMRSETGTTRNAEFEPQDANRKT